MGVAIVWLVNTLVSLLTWAIIGAAILSWLVAFDVINYRNRFVANIAAVLDGVTRPLLAPFQRIIPPMGGIDLSPIVALLALHFARIVFNQMAAGPLIALLG